MTTKRNPASSVIRDCRKVAQAVQNELVEFHDIPKYEQVDDDQYLASKEDEKAERIRKAIQDKLDECIENLRKLRKLIPVLNGCNAYRARITESTLLDMIEQLEKMLAELSSGTIPTPINKDNNANSVSYHSIAEPQLESGDSIRPIEEDKDAPLIVYHELGEQYEN